MRITKLVIVSFHLNNRVFFMKTSGRKSDIFRVVNGYDDCANVSGMITPAENDPPFRFLCKILVL